LPRHFRAISKARRQHDIQSVVFPLIFDQLRSDVARILDRTLPHASAVLTGD